MFHLRCDIQTNSFYLLVSWSSLNFFSLNILCWLRDLCVYVNKFCTLYKLYVGCLSETLHIFRIQPVSTVSVTLEISIANSFSLCCLFLAFCISWHYPSVRFIRKCMFILNTCVYIWYACMCMYVNGYFEFRRIRVVEWIWKSIWLSVDMNWNGRITYVEVAKNLKAYKSCYSK